MASSPTASSTTCPGPTATWSRPRASIPRTASRCNGWRALGIPTGLISGRVSPATVERAKQCKFKYVYQGHTEKIPILEEILADAKIDPDEVAYIGDDFTDVVVMRRVGLAIATANARPEVKQIAHYVTQAPGGQGAVREVIELLLKAQGKWAEILKHYEICL